MAVRIRCSECHKKIAVDEAFAGSMCRCPYCKSIVIVPQEISASEAHTTPARPAAPGRPSSPGRPSKPGGKSKPATLKGSGLRDIVGSRPIVSGEEITPVEVGETIIKEPGRPQVPGVDTAPTAPKSKPKPVARPKPQAAPQPISPPAARPKPVDDEPADASSALDALLAAAGEKPAAPKPDATPKPAKPEPKPKKVKVKKVKPEPKPKKVKVKKVKPAPVPEPVLEDDDDDDVIETISVDVSKFTPEQLAAIPMANPVKLQGMVTILLSVVLLIAISLCVYLSIRVFGNEANDPANDDTNGAYLPGEDPSVTHKIESLPNPFATSASPSIAGVGLDGTVIYCFDTGGSMKGLYAVARDVMRVSAKSLGSSQTFGVVLAREDAPLLIENKLLPGGADGEKTIRQPTKPDHDGGPIAIGGLCDLTAALNLALTHKPKTVVMLVSGKDFDWTPLADAAKKAGARLLIFPVEPLRKDIFETMEKAAQTVGAGSKVISYKDNTLYDFHNDYINP